MRAGVLAVLLVLIARHGLAQVGPQVGAPVEGQAASAGPAGVFVGWAGTDDDPGHEVEGAALGGFTLLGASAAGGPVIASLPKPWPPPTPQPLPFIVTNVPPGTYWVVVVKGLTTSTALVPLSAWQRVVVPAPCTTAPLAPVNLTAFQGGSNNSTVRWDDAPGSCAATSYELHAGYGPGLSNAGASSNTEITVDSMPSGHGPPSRIVAGRSSSSASTWAAVVGLIRPERLALGAAIGSFAAASSACATG